MPVSQKVSGAWYNAKPSAYSFYMRPNIPLNFHICISITFKKTLQKVEEASNILFKWFSNNYMVTNADKCHLLTSTPEVRRSQY